MVKINYQARSRRFRKYRSIRRRRYNRMSVGRKALMQASRALRLANSVRPNIHLREEASYTTAVTLGNRHSTAASISVALTRVAQGDAISQRIGNTVSAKYLQVPFICNILDAASPTQNLDRQVGVRMMLVQVNDFKVHGTFPNIHTILDDDGSADGDIQPMLSQYRPKRVAPNSEGREREFNVLMDRRFWLHEQVSGGDQQRITGMLKLRWPKGKKLRFEDATDTSYENPIVLYALATNGDNVAKSRAQLSYKYKFYFYGE